MGKRYSSNKKTITMKSTYKTPLMMAIEIRTKYLISESTTNQGVHTDDPQPPGNALVKDLSNKSVWDEEW